MISSTQSSENVTLGDIFPSGDIPVSFLRYMYMNMSIEFIDETPPVSPNLHSVSIKELSEPRKCL